MGQRGVGGVSIIFGALLASVFGAISLIIITNTLVASGLSINTGLWSLLPLLIPAVVILVLLISIYAFFRPME
jgi:hypothetical protein